MNAAIEQVTNLTASLELAKKRVAQNTELVAAGAGNRFDLEQSQTSVNELTAQIAGGARERARRCARNSPAASRGDLAARRAGQGADRHRDGAGQDVGGAGGDDHARSSTTPAGS